MPVLRWWVMPTWHSIQYSCLRWVCSHSSMHAYTHTCNTYTHSPFPPRPLQNMEQCECHEEDICEDHCNWICHTLDIEFPFFRGRKRHLNIYDIRHVISGHISSNKPMHPKLHEFIDEYLSRVELTSYAVFHLRLPFNQIAVDTRQLPQIKGPFGRRM